VSEAVDGVRSEEDVRALMRACHLRDLDREGIPMVLGLVDERGAIPRSTDASALAEGAAYRDRLERYHRELVPFAREGDEGALITAMQVVAYAHFEPGAAGAGPVAATPPADA